MTCYLRPENPDYLLGTTRTTRINFDDQFLRRSDHLAPANRPFGSTFFSLLLPRTRTPLTIPLEHDTMRTERGLCFTDTVSSGAKFNAFGRAVYSGNACYGMRCVLNHGNSMLRAYTTDVGLLCDCGK